VISARSFRVPKQELKPQTQALYEGAVAKHPQYFAASPDQLDDEHVRQDHPHPT